MRLGTKLAVWAMTVSLCVGCAATTSFYTKPQVQPQPRPVRPTPAFPLFPADLSDTLDTYGVYVVNTGTGYGSGFSMSDTIVVTAFHVVHNAAVIFVDGEPAELLASNEEMDIAILRVRCRPRPHLELAEPERGDVVRAVGYAGYKSGVWSMIVEGRVAGFAGGYVTVTGGIGPGMSGGPLLDTEGRVVGLTSHAFVWQRWGTPNPTLVNFVPSNWIRTVLIETPFYTENE